jgi:hypothetical protein
MWQPAPLKKSDIEAGGRYIEVVVCVNGTIYLEKHTFLAAPIRRKDGWWVRVSRRKSWMDRGDDSGLSFCHLGNMGLMKNRKWGDNHHRTFRATRATERFLKQFEQERGQQERYVAYLEFLGFKNAKDLVQRKLAG